MEKGALQQVERAGRCHGAHEHQRQRREMRQHRFKQQASNLDEVKGNEEAHASNASESSKSSNSSQQDQDRLAMSATGEMQEGRKDAWILSGESAAVSCNTYCFLDVVVVTGMPKAAREPRGSRKLRKRTLV